MEKKLFFTGIGGFNSIIFDNIPGSDVYYEITPGQVWSLQVEENGQITGYSADFLGAAKLTGTIESTETDITLRLTKIYLDSQALQPVNYYLNGKPLQIFKRDRSAHQQDMQFSLLEGWWWIGEKEKKEYHAWLVIVDFEIHPKILWDKGITKRNLKPSDVLTAFKIGEKL